MSDQIQPQRHLHWLGTSTPLRGRELRIFQDGYEKGVSEGRRQAAEDGDAGIPLDVVALLFKLYDTVWNKVAAYDGGPEGYSLVTWADQMLVEEAASPIEEHEPMLRVALANLLDPPSVEQPEGSDHRG
jgi:hypothetical protein